MSTISEIMANKHLLELINDSQSIFNIANGVIDTYLINPTQTSVSEFISTFNTTFRQYEQFFKVLNSRIRILTGSGVYTPPNGINRIYFIAIGQGGSGGVIHRGTNTASSAHFGSSGGGSGYITSGILDVPSNRQISYACGDSNNKVTADGLQDLDGIDGAPTTFGGYTALGGKGGIQQWQLDGTLEGGAGAARGGSVTASSSNGSWTDGEMIDDTNLLVKACANGAGNYLSNAKRVCGGGAGGLLDPNILGGNGVSNSIVVGQGGHGYGAGSAGIISVTATTAVVYSDKGAPGAVFVIE